MPGVIKLPESSHRVHLNPEDDRAYKKLVMDSTRGRISTPMHFWRDHVEATAPSICLDVGANYGECFAFGDYPRSLCIAVEANPVLQPYLTRTRDEHPSASRILIEPYLVGDRDGIQASLYYSPKWTGGGSAVEGGENLVEAKVVSRTLDAIVNEHTEWRDRPLVLKMDIEGYEGHALTGFTDLFRRERVVGILEFDTGMLSKVNSDPEAIFNMLIERFSVFITFPRKRILRPIKRWGELMNQAKNGGLHCDLAFASRPQMIATNWNIS
jgi:FkbM family methyltransferase